MAIENMFPHSVGYGITQESVSKIQNPYFSLTTIFGLWGSYFAIKNELRAIIYKLKKTEHT